MRMDTVSAIIFFMFLICNRAIAEPLPSHSNQKSAGESPLSRIARDTGLIRSKYQSDGDVCQDRNNTGCLPEGITTAPETLVECVDGRCMCNECFMTDDSTGRCRVCSDYPALDNGECGTDSRQSQLTAFLLSFFLSSTGAANFYIGRNDLAGGQLFILLLTFVLSYATCCIPCCMACCMAKDEIKGSIAYMCFILIFVLILLACSFILLGWWIADLVIFVTNQRLSGSGCELISDL